MKVNINGTEFEYQSDYPHDWKFSAGDPFKFPVLIGGKACFVKRFEQKNPKNISGWELLLKLKGLSEPHLSKIFDIKQEIEKGKDIYYIFYEFLDGTTLDNRLRTADVSLSTLTSNLFSGIRSIQKYNFWFADFCEKNIFCLNDGTFAFVDIDSTQKLTDMPDNEMYGSKDYWILVFKFYKEILNKNNLKLSDINGISFNYLQIVFLILRLKLFYLTKRKDYNSPELYNQLPARLNAVLPEIKTLFLNILQYGRQPILENEISQLEKLVIDKIVNVGEISDIPVTITNLPVIKEFKTDKQELERGGQFILSWQVENTNKLELYKNGAMYRTLDINQNYLALSGFADGTQQQYIFQLIAYKDLSVTKSQEVVVQLKQFRVNNSGINKKKAIIAGISTIILAIIVLILALKPKIEASIKQNYIWQGIDSTITITGNNLPVDKDLEIILNDTIVPFTVGNEDSLIVAIPDKKITTYSDDIVYVSLYYGNRKTFHVGYFALYPPITTKQKLLPRNQPITFYGRNLNSGTIKVYVDNVEIPIVSSSNDSMSAHVMNYPLTHKRRLNLMIKDNEKVIYSKMIPKGSWQNPHFPFDVIFEEPIVGGIILDN